MLISLFYDLPFGTHRHLVHGLTNGLHPKKMLYSRYAKFLKSVANNRRPALRGLLNTAVGSCQSVVGGNIRTVLVDTNIKIVPGVTTPAAFKNYQVYETPPGSEWKLPLLVSLLEMKE